MTIGRQAEVINTWDPEWVPPTPAQCAQAVSDAGITKQQIREWVLRQPATDTADERSAIFFWRERGVLRARVRT